MLYSVYLTATINLKDTLEKYLKSSEYHLDIKQLREKLRYVRDEKKLNILQHTTDWCTGITALHIAAYRDDAEMITTVLSSLKSTDRLKLLMKKDFIKRTPLHVAVAGGHEESLMALLCTLTAPQKVQLLKDEDLSTKLLIGETLEALLRHE